MIRHSARDAKLTVSAPQGRQFADWLSDRLDELYENYQLEDKH